MTNKEAIDLLEEVRVLDDSIYSYNKAYSEALEMALTALEAEEAWYESHEYPHKEQWIPVTERLPIPNERIGNVRKYYLIQNEYGDMMVACYSGEWEQIYRHEYCLDKVVAWMPLPDLWKGEQDEIDKE